MTEKLENIEPNNRPEEQIITYLEEDAGKIRAHVAGQLLPGQEIIYALLLRVAGLNTTAENVHDGWAAWRLLCRPDDKHKDLKLIQLLGKSIYDNRRKIRKKMLSSLSFLTYRD